MATYVGADDGQHELAQKTLVFLAVGLNCHLKIPLGYFFVNTTTPTKLCNLTKICLDLLYEINVNVPSITFDGAMAGMLN